MALTVHHLQPGELRLAGNRLTLLAQEGHTIDLCRPEIGDIVGVLLNFGELVLLCLLTLVEHVNDVIPTEGAALVGVVGKDSCIEAVRAAELIQGEFDDVGPCVVEGRVKSQLPGMIKNSIKGYKE